jgi:hypothetical protein
VYLVEGLSALPPSVKGATDPRREAAVSQRLNGPAGDDDEGRLVAALTYERCVTLAREHAQVIEEVAVVRSVMLGVHGPDEPDLRRIELGLVDRADTVVQLARLALERLARRGVDVRKAFRDANSELDKEDPGRLDEFERGMGPVVETARGVVRDPQLAESAGRHAPAAHALARPPSSATPTA